MSDRVPLLDRRKTAPGAPFHACAALIAGTPRSAFLVRDFRLPPRVHSSSVLTSPGRRRLCQVVSRNEPCSDSRLGCPSEGEAQRPCASAAVIVPPHCHL